MSVWVSACRVLEVDGAKGKGRDTKTWNECVKVDMKGVVCSGRTLRFEIGGGV